MKIQSFKPWVKSQFMLALAMLCLASIVYSQTNAQRVYRTKTGKTIIITEKKNTMGRSDIVVSMKGLKTGTVSFTDQNPIEQVIKEDLDGNGYDEIFIITSSRDKDSWGAIMGVASNRDKSITPIYVPEMDEASQAPGQAFEGYRGFDEFEVMENTLARRFPLFNAAGQKTGKSRYIYYKVKAGEAGWKLVINKFDTF